MPDTSSDTTSTDRRYEPPVIAVLAFFVVVAFALTLRDLTRLRTFVAGDSGDSLLNMWIMRSVQHGLLHGWHTLWNPPNFRPASNTLAYSDTLLPVALIDWPLRLIAGDVVAFNVIYLGAWVLSSWCTYRLALRVAHDWRAAIVGALSYTYAAMRLVHQGHFQLVVGGAVVPLVLLLLFRCLDAPSAGRAVALGLAYAGLTLTASYYGAITGVIVIIVVAGWVWLSPRDARRAPLRALLTAAAVVAVVAGPFAYQYVRLERQPEFRRGFDPASAAHFADFVATGTDSYVLRHLPVIGPDSRPTSRGVENRLFTGIVATAFGALGLVLVVRAGRQAGWRQPRIRDMVLVAGAGAACVILAFGDRFTIAHHKIPLPFYLFRHGVPGFAGVRATARLAIGGQLALALLAAGGFDWVLRRSTKTVVKSTMTAALVGLVVLETAMGLNFVRVPTAADDGGVDAALRARPAGAVLELPINSSASGAAWPYVEAPRQLAALRDGHPRVNGYSGFQPKNYDTLVAELDQFPQPDAVAAVKALQVRYVVLRTRLVGEVSPSALTVQLDANGVGRYDQATVQGILAGLPQVPAVSVTRLPGGYLIDLGR